MSAISQEEFEQLLDDAAARLTEQGVAAPFESSKALEQAVRDVIQELGRHYGLEIDYDPHPYAFPDIAVGEFGVEVKFTTGDSWRSVANSIFESHRSHDVELIYVMYGKMGGVPAVRWDHYDDCVIHVRTSHVPRFELEIGASESLFEKFGVPYDDFRRLDIEEKMKLVRRYARGRLQAGEHLWWLDDPDESDHSLPANPRVYMNLAADEKRQLRAEAALLCPQIVRPSRHRGGKYVEAAVYILTYHGVFCPQARDLFSAGSVAGVERGGNYVLRALQDIEDEMRTAAQTLDNALFEEYWGRAVEPDDRIREWLVLADEYARDWTPSEHLFLAEQ